MSGTVKGVSGILSAPPYPRARGPVIDASTFNQAMAQIERSFALDNMMDEANAPDPNQVLYGTGADGNVTITSATTLTQDAQYLNLVFTGSNSTHQLFTAGFVVYVAGTLDLSGWTGTSGAIVSVPTDGGNASGSTGGGAPVAPSTATTVGPGYQGVAGVDGGAGAGANGNNGTNPTGSVLFGGVGGAGGAGGASGSAGGTGGAVIELSTVFEITSAQGVLLPTFLGPINGGGIGASGGAGGGDGANSGGGSGAASNGQRVIQIFARAINRSATTGTGAIRAQGRPGKSGGTATAGNAAGGGGSGGGGGGYIDITCGKLVGTVCSTLIDVSGGAGGAGGNAHGTGVGGDGGGGGNAGAFCVRVLNVPSITYQSPDSVIGSAGTAGSGATGGAGGAGGTLQAAL